MADSKKAKAKVLSSKVVYRGPAFFVTTDQIVEPSGIKTRRDVVRHNGSVVVMAVDDTTAEPRVLLVRQYRHAAGKHMWEFPAGHIDPGEKPLVAAKRELQEETGYTARQWKRALFFYVSPGFLSEFMAAYLAQGLKQGEAAPEEDEVIRKRMFPISQAAEMAVKGLLQDAKTISGVLWLERAWKQGSLPSGQASVRSRANGGRTRLRRR